MQIARQDLEKSQTELTVTVEPTEIQDALEKAANKLSETIQIPGFRGGRAPYEVMKRAVGKRACWKRFRGSSWRRFPERLSGRSWRSPALPQIDPINLRPGNPIVYKARMSLLPRVTIKNYQSLTVDRQAVAISDDDVEKTIQQLRRLRAKETLVTRSAQKDDRVEIDFTISLGNVPIDGGAGEKTSCCFREAVSSL